MTKMVRGPAVAQYIQNRSDMTALPGLADQSNMLMEKKDCESVGLYFDGMWKCNETDWELTATKVAGRNTILMRARVRIAELSSFAASAIFMDADAISKFDLLSRCTTRL
jgi:hypothetical protein